MKSNLVNYISISENNRYDTPGDKKSAFYLCPFKPRKTDN